MHARLRNVLYLDKERIWTSGEGNEIKCFNSKGSIIQKINTKSKKWPSGLAVDTDGDILYSDWLILTVNKVKNGRIEELIRLRGLRPLQLCLTSTSDLLVTIYSDHKSQSEVVRFSGSIEKQIIQFDGEGKPLYSGTKKVKYISEKRNHDICVADFGAGAVVVVNQDGKPRWRYTSNSSVTNKKPFTPWGITTDTQSLILTADHNNHCIHILYSGNGYTKYITENRNHDICVADLGAGAVVVVNQDRKLRWRYTGHPLVNKNEPFKPWGISTDSQSRILTADYNNHCIHILDQNGQFLRYIDNCDLKCPCGVCVNNNDSLIVCEYEKGTVKEIKYRILVCDNQE